MQGILSVIVPVYNVENYLHRCVDSLVSQDGFSDVKIYLVDDGSTDSCPAICDEYGKKYDNIEVIHKKNGGLSDARNTAVKLADSQYIMFLDSDDFYVSGIFSTINKIVSQKDVDIIRFNCTFERTLNEYTLSGSRDVSYITAEDMLNELITCKIGNQACLNVYKASLFEDILYPYGKAYEDISTTYKLIMKAGTVAEIDYTYYVYNIANDSSITKNSSYKNISDMYYAVCDQYEALSKYFEDKPDSLKYLSYYVLDKNIYIYFKLRREVPASEERNMLMREVKATIKKSVPVSLRKYRYYNWKKYIYFLFVYIWGQQ